MGWPIYQAAHEADESVRVEHCFCDLYVEPSGRHARFNYSFKIINISAEDESSYQFSIPAPIDQVKKSHAEDQEGTLLTSLVSSSPSFSELNVQYRGPVAKNRSYEFSLGFSYAMPSIISDEMIARTVVIQHWVVHRHRCGRQVVRIHLPKRATLLQAEPPAQNSNPIIFQINDLRPEEPFTCFLGYRQFRVGSRFVLWLAGALGAGFLGSFF